MNSLPSRSPDSSYLPYLEQDEVNLMTFIGCWSIKKQFTFLCNHKRSLQIQVSQSYQQRKGFVFLIKCATHCSRFSLSSTTPQFNTSVQKNPDTTFQPPNSVSSTQKSSVQHTLQFNTSIQQKKTKKALYKRVLICVELTGVLN